MAALTLGIWSDDSIVFKNTEKNVEEVKEVVEEVKDNQHSPLITAIRAGDKEKVRNSAGTDINVVDESGVSPLIAAVIKGDAEIVDILIKAGADVNLRLENGDTAIGAAIKENNFKIAEMLTNAGAAMAARRDMSIWLLAWFGGVQKRQPDLRIFGLLREKKVPFFIEETTLLERLFFPFGLIH